MYRRDLVLSVGGYTDFARMEDYLLWAKLILAGARVANVAEPLVKYRVGAGAYTRRGGLAQLRAELERAAPVPPARLHHPQPVPAQRRWCAAGTGWCPSSCGAPRIDA